MSREKPDTWMPLVIGDYKRDTGRLTRDLHGGYLLLIMEYWTTGPLPDDDTELAAIVLATQKEWKVIRPKLVRFFRVEDGFWRHKRIDAELAEWTRRKAKAVERASAGGRAKAAKSSASSTATSTPQAVLAGCSVPKPTEVDGLTGQSTLCAQNEFVGPKEVRDAFLAKHGEEWVRSYVDPCGWQDVPERALIPATRYAGSKLVREGRSVLAALGLSVLERAA